MLKYFNIAAISSLAVLASHMANARDLVIAGWGGVYQEVQREAYFQPFANDKGIKFIEATYLGGLAQVKTMADTGDVTWDLVIVEGADLKVGCEEGLFEKLDWNKIPLKDKLLPAAIQDCGVGNVVIGIGLAYNTEALPTAPTDVADFFNTAKFPGKRGMRAGPKFNLEFALLSDGVPPNEVYNVLATPQGLDRAFAKLDSIKKDLQFWDAGAQPVEWLVANNVAMSFSYNGRIAAAKSEGKPLAFVWAHLIYSIDAWAIPANAPNKDLSLEFLGFVNSPERQANFSRKMNYGPSNVEATALLSNAEKADLPAGTNMASALFFSDPFWIDNTDSITERWNNWINQ